MKIIYEFVPRLDFLNAAAEVKDLVDGFNVTDSAGGVPAPSATAVACVLKAKYPDKVTIPMFITNYKGPVEIGADALACEAMNIDGILPDPGDPPKYGNLIWTKEDGSVQVLSNPDEVAEYRRSTGPAEGVRNFLRNSIKIKNLKIGCLLTARRPVEDAIARINNAWDFGFFLRLEEASLPKLKELGAECKRLGKPLYPYFFVETAKNKKSMERIGWPASATMENAEKFAEKLAGIVEGVIPTCLGDAAGNIELLQKIQKFR